MLRYRSIEDLPPSIPIFPLTGALLLPRGHLPLNVFEPRYLAMVDVALSGSRLIGMIQPLDADSPAGTPALSRVGCAGRIVSWRETDDGRMLVTLQGVCRFRVAEEVDTPTPYRLVRADYAPYLGDLAETAPETFPRKRVIGALKDYLSRRELKADWESVMSAPPDMLVNALTMLCPFEPAEKQALLEAQGWSDRVETLVALLQLSGAPSPGGSSALN
jgi:Lon protease-like protein